MSQVHGHGWIILIYLFFSSVETYLTHSIIELPRIFEYQPVTIWVLFKVADDIWGKKIFFTKELSRNNYTDSSSCYLLHLWSFTYNWRRIFCNKTSMNQRQPGLNSNRVPSTYVLASSIFYCRQNIQPEAEAAWLVDLLFWLLYAFSLVPESMYIMTCSQRSSIP